MIAHINIGSNLGNRADNIRRAVALLSQKVGTVTAQSQLLESDAEGYDSPNRFLNQGINVETTLSAVEIVEQLQAIEREIDPAGRHRNPSGDYCDRQIDLDLILLGNTISNDPRALVPHPRMHQRDFVLTPLTEIGAGVFKYCLQNSKNKQY